MDDNRTTLEVIAQTIDKAIQKGLQDLGVSRKDVEVEILDEGNQGGLLGIGSRQARVRISVKPGQTKPAVQDPAPPETTPDDTQDDQAIPRLAEDIVIELLEKMNLKARVKARYGEGSDNLPYRPVLVDVTGDDLSVLIGRRAKTLNALQYVTRLIMGKELERGVPLSIDVAGYRKRREEQVRKIARRIAQQVKDTQLRQSLEPMPPNERRFAHIELKDDPGVYTESTGEDPHRKVVIYPEK